MPELKCRFNFTKKVYKPKNLRYIYPKIQPFKTNTNQERRNWWKHQAEDDPLRHLREGLVLYLSSVNVTFFFPFF